MYIYCTRWTFSDIHGSPLFLLYGRAYPRKIEPASVSAVRGAFFSPRKVAGWIYQVGREEYPNQDSDRLSNSAWGCVTAILYVCVGVRVWESQGQSLGHRRIQDLPHSQSSSYSRLVDGRDKTTWRGLAASGLLADTGSACHGFVSHRAFHSFYTKQAATGLFLHTISFEWLSCAMLHQRSAEHPAARSPFPWFRVEQALCISDLLALWNLSIPHFRADGLGIHRRQSLGWRFCVERM